MRRKILLVFLEKKEKDNQGAKCEPLASDDIIRQSRNETTSTQQRANRRHSAQKGLARALSLSLARVWVWVRI